MWARWHDERRPVVCRSLLDALERPDPAPARFHPLLNAALAVLAVFAGIGIVALAVALGVLQ